MQKTKIDFIVDLLADKRMDISLKEMAFEMAAKQISNIETESLKQLSEIKNDVKNILSAVNKNNDGIVEIQTQIEAKGIDTNSRTTDTRDTKKTTKNFKEKEHKPKDVAEFMSLFNLPTGLKYLTHDFDEGGDFEIDIFLSKTKSVFNKYSKSLTIPQSLWSIINQFAFSDDPNWGNKQTDGWSKIEWIEWSKKHKKHLKRNPVFEQIIEQFRNYTRIESPQLTSILNEVIKDKFNEEFNQIDLNIVDCDKADFYTHVDNFKESIKLIFDGIKKRIIHNNKITISYLRKTDGDYFERIIKICHHNSFPTKPLDEFVDEIRKEEKGELGDISRKLRGYCNWSIETNWDNQPVRINILQETGKISIDDLDKDISLDGFTHILTFYYK